MVNKAEVLLSERIVNCLVRRVVGTCQRGSSHKYFWKSKMLKTFFFFVFIIFFLWSNRTTLALVKHLLDVLE